MFDKSLQGDIVVMPGIESIQGPDGFRTSTPNVLWIWSVDLAESLSKAAEMVV